MSNSSSRNNNKKDNKKNQTKDSQKNSNNNDDDIIVFESKEKELLDETAKDLNIDLANDSDLHNIPPDIEDLKPEDLDKLINDKDTKTLIREIGNNPTIMDTIRNSDDLGNLSLEDIKQIGEEKAATRYELIMNLANADTLKLHLNMGIRDNKEIWIEKEFWFKSFDQKQRFYLSTLESRLQSLRIKHTLLINKPFQELTEADRNYMVIAPMMINIASYRYQEYEYKLKFGMTTDDYNRVSSAELDLAREIYEEHIKSIPSYNRRRFSNSSKGGSGTTLSQMTSL